MLVQTLGWEDPLEKEMETHSSILAWRIPWTEEPEWATVHGATKNQTRLEQQRACISKKEDIVFQLLSLDYNLP